MALKLASKQCNRRVAGLKKGADRPLPLFDSNIFEYC
jgi:hypothetical protein